MRIVAETGHDDLARIYIAENDKGKLIEFVHSLQPPLPREKKWVLTISTLFGCPVGCAFCDAGGWYSGKLSRDELLWQIDHLVRSIYPDGNIPTEKFKIQFARTGEPAFNTAVLDALEVLPNLYNAPGLMPSLSTIAPKGTDAFFERLIHVKNSLYTGHFQLQFSIHSTDYAQRDALLPVPKWSFNQINQYAAQFRKPGDRKVTLNFALAEDSIVEPQAIEDNFDTEHFIIKLTPINPTGMAQKSGIVSCWNRAAQLIEDFTRRGFDVAPSFGEQEENRIGSNCGQFITHYRRRLTETPAAMDDKSYTYELREV